MQKKILPLALCLMCVGLCACGKEKGDTSVQSTVSTTTTVTEQETNPTETTQSDKTTATASEKTEIAKEENTLADKTEAAQPDATEAEPVGQSESKSDTLTEDQALEAIKKYCFNKDPNLKEMTDSSEYNIYWDVTTNASNEIVVLYRSYTGAQIRYYIDPVSGETYVTELVPGIIDEEQRTEESLNVSDYLS